MKRLYKKKAFNVLKAFFLCVPGTRVELARLSTLAPETSASTIPPPGQGLFQFVNHLDEVAFALQADPRIQHFAILQEDQHRDVAHAKLHGDFVVFVGIALGDDHFIFVLLRQLVHDG